MILKEKGYIKNFFIDEADLQWLEENKRDYYLVWKNNGGKELHDDEVFGRLFPRVEDMDERAKKNLGVDFNISEFFRLFGEYYIRCCVRDRRKWDPNNFIVVPEETYFKRILKDDNPERCNPADGLKELEWDCLARRYRRAFAHFGNSESSGRRYCYYSPD